MGPNLDQARVTLLQAAALVTPAPHDTIERNTVWWPFVRQLALELGPQTQQLTRDQAKCVSTNTYIGQINAVQRHRSGRAIIRITPANSNLHEDYGYTDFLTNRSGVELAAIAAAAIGQTVSYVKRREIKGGASSRNGTPTTTPRIDAIFTIDNAPITLPSTATQIIEQGKAAGIDDASIRESSATFQPNATATQFHTLWLALIDHLPTA